MLNTMVLKSGPLLQVGKKFPLPELPFNFQKIFNFQMAVAPRVYIQIQWLTPQNARITFLCQFHKHSHIFHPQSFLLTFLLLIFENLAKKKLKKHIKNEQRKKFDIEKKKEKNFDRRPKRRGRNGRRPKRHGRNGTAETAWPKRHGRNGRVRAIFVFCISEPVLPKSTTIAWNAWPSSSKNIPMEKRYISKTWTKSS